MSQYRELQTFYGKYIVRDDGDSVTSFPANEDNTDYQRYLDWLAAGNEPEVIEG